LEEKQFPIKEGLKGIKEVGRKTVSNKGGVKGDKQSGSP